MKVTMKVTGVPPFEVPRRSVGVTGALRAPPALAGPAATAVLDAVDPTSHGEVFCSKNAEFTNDANRSPTKTVI